MNLIGSGASLGSLALLVLSGCASPGTPRPPSLNLPETVVSIDADRLGDTVRLRWSTTGRTTDGLNVHGTMMAEVCREVAGASGCMPVLHIPAKAGPSEAMDRLPSSLTREPIQAIAYRVRILNVRGRSAGESPSGVTASGPAPASIQELRAEPAEQGVLLRWHPDGSAEAVEVERRKLGGQPTATRKATGLARSEAEPIEVHLKGTVDAERAGGLLDRTAKLGQPYTYTARRVRSVSVENRTVEVRSAASAEAAITLRDVFPPRPPRGLVAISGTDGVDLSVDLSWEPNTEPDLAGYLVYRREQGQTGTPAALNPSLLAAPAFHDPTVIAGHIYRYSVVAVDRTGNRSVASEPVIEAVRVP